MNAADRLKAPKNTVDNSNNGKSLTNVLVNLTMCQSELATATANAGKTKN